MNARLARLAILALVVVYGVFVGHSTARWAPPPRIGDFLFMVSLTPLSYVWYFLDARERNYPRSSGLGAAVILMAMLAVPYYLVRSRPAGARLQAVLHYVGFVVLSLILFFTAALLLVLVSQVG
ncbi:hypothetical protein [Methylibium sp.]|uniref:hypothetical protein n=1 Tax=Methylibium sp. TaxID=2067992 RepID=UPI003D120C08